MYYRVVESVYLLSPDGQECNKPVVVTVALPYKYGECVTVQGQLMEEYTTHSSVTSRLLCSAQVYDYYFPSLCLFDTPRCLLYLFPVAMYR